VSGRGPERLTPSYGSSRSNDQASLITGEGPTVINPSRLCRPSYAVSPMVSRLGQTRVSPRPVAIQLHPILVRRGSADALPIPEGPLPGAIVDSSYEEHQLELVPHGTLLMCTDGPIRAPAAAASKTRSTVFSPPLVHRSPNLIRPGGACCAVTCRVSSAWPETALWQD
jgi:hypothetical protein